MHHTKNTASKIAETVWTTAIANYMENIGFLFNTSDEWMIKSDTFFSTKMSDSEFAANASCNGMIRCQVPLHLGGLSSQYWLQVTVSSIILTAVIEYVG